MADQKLSALTELDATPADTDEVYIRDVSEEPATESKRITVLNLLGDLVSHIAASVVHGAVSTATASKIVIRDASARAKFGAPGASGDALIKGTRHLIAEMPTLTTGKIWKGVGGVPVVSDLPAAGKSISTGSYAGNAADGRQITTGFKCSLVITQQTTDARRVTMIPSRSILDHVSSDNVDCTARQYLHATDGFVVSQAVDANNETGRTYYYWAISE